MAHFKLLLFLPWPSLSFAYRLQCDSAGLGHRFRPILHLSLGRLVLLDQLEFLLLVEGRVLQLGHVVALASLIERPHPHLVNLVQDQVLVFNAHSLEQLLQAGTLAWDGAFRRELNLVFLRVRRIRRIEVGVKLVNTAALRISIKTILDFKGIRCLLATRDFKAPFASVRTFERR